MIKPLNKYWPEVRERAVWMVLNNEGQHANGWCVIRPGLWKIGVSVQTPNE